MKNLKLSSAFLQGMAEGFPRFFDFLPEGIEVTLKADNLETFMGMILERRNLEG